jgi:putative ABC transport system permease protein
VATPGPLTWAQVKQLNTHGLVAVSRHVLAHPPSPAERYPEFAAENRFEVGVPGLVGGLAMLEIVLLAGPAFAVGARRRRRDLGLVAAAGGPRRTCAGSSWPTAWCSAWCPPPPA